MPSDPPANNLANRLQRYLPRSLWPSLAEGAGEAVRQHLEAVLSAVLTYVPEYVAQRRLPGQAGPPASAELAQASMLFADISGFTAMSERLTQLGREGAEVITAIVNDYFAAMLAIIARHQGDLFKFGGDALLVCFRGEQAALRACQAAYAMQQAMGRFERLETAQGVFNLRMKVGLGSGRLLLTSLGWGERNELLLLGPALTSMAHAEHLAAPGEVLLDEATRLAAGEGLEVAPRPEGYHALLASPPASQVEAAPASPPVTAALPELVEALEALSPYLPSAVLQRVIESPGRVMIEGEHRLVTVLFANFYGIDELVEQASAQQVEALAALLNQHFAAMQQIVGRYGGVVNKVDTYAMGYRLMVIFGAPVAHENDPENAVAAALEMQAAGQAFAGLESPAGRFTLRQRTGINTGYVFAGNLGARLRQEYSVMGDEVNLAARLMGVAEEGQVLISQATARHVSGLFESQERPAVSVKGKSQPVRNYLVSGRAERRTPAASSKGRFVGRQAELALVRSLVDAAMRGQGAVLDLYGEAGVGKSRLVAELADHARWQGMFSLRGEAVSYGQSIPYLPWMGALNALLGLAQGASLEQRRARLLRVLAAAELSDWAPIIGGVLGLEVEENPLTASLDAQMRQQRFFDVVLQLLLAQAAQQPLLLVLDDLYWADSASLELITYVARNIQAASLLFVLLRRPSEQPMSWASGEHYHPLHLTELDDQVSLELVRTVLGEAALSLALQRLILERAQGNPLFVGEVARALREAGAIHVQPDALGQPTWDLPAGEAPVDVPTTLTGLIMSRIDRLETAPRQVIQVASVIGVNFRAPVLERVYPYGDLDSGLQPPLQDLVRMDLAMYEPPEQYAFKHNLTQEVAYGSLSFARRRELHVRVGEDLEQRSAASSLAEQYGVLAHHFFEGRVYGRAFDYLVKAGDKARAEFANDAALNHYRRALEIAANPKIAPPEAAERQGEILEAMGEVNLLTSEYEAAIGQFRQALEQPGCTARRRADLLCKIARAYEQQTKYEEALDQLDQGKQVLQTSQADQQSLPMARIYGLLGWIHHRRSEMDAAIQSCQEALSILDQLESNAERLAEEASVYSTLGGVYVSNGQYPEAVDYYQRSTALRQQAGDLPGLARSYNNLALIAWAQGDLALAGDHLRRMLEISQQIGNTYFLAYGYNNLGVVYYSMGEPGRAIELYHDALTLRRRLGDSYGAARTCSNLGESYLSVKQYEDARKYLEQAAKSFEALGRKGDLPEAFRLLAEVELAQNAAESALDYAHRARNLAAELGNPELQGLAERAMARIQNAMGDQTQAIQMLESSLALLNQAGNQVELARSYYEYGKLLAQLPGRVEAARQQLQQAVALFSAAGAEKDAEEARRALEGV